MGQTGSKEDIDFVQLVGKGFFGEVYKAKYKGSRVPSGVSHSKDKDASHGSSKDEKTNGQFVAVKQITKALIDEYKLEGQLHREVNILKELDHPNIVKLYFSWEDDDYHYIVMEYVKTNLFELLKTEKRFAPLRAGKFFQGSGRRFAIFACS